MRSLLLIIGALALNGLGAGAQDFRTVNGRLVDLQPLHDWEAGGRHGERPLKHWQEIEVVGWQANGPRGHPVATIRLTNGAPHQVWLKNCPQRIIDDFARIAELEQQQTAAQHQAHLAQARADAVKSTQTAGVVVMGDPAYLNTLAAEEQARANAGAVAAGAANAEAKVSADLTLARAKLASENKVLAMDTGVDYGPQNIWDTGLTGPR